MVTLNSLIALVFICTIAIEAFLNAKDNLDHYDKDESKVNLIIGALGALVNIVVKGFMLSFFIWLSAYAFFDFGRSPIVWLILFFITDLEYYLFHLLGHKSRFFWAMHVIHHSSFKYNFTTAVRTPFTNSVFRFGCLTPFVILGFDPVMIIIMDSLLVSFTFFQHTEMIKKLGWLEYILSTPSHHRVHHASDEKYIDKNFGGVLIIWDKLFGTFQEEEEQPTYGITKPLKNRGVVNVLFHEWLDIFDDLFKASSWKQRVIHVFGRPGWKPTEQVNSNGKYKIYGQQFQSNKNWIARIAFITTLYLFLTFLVSAQPGFHISRGIVHQERFEDELALRYFEEAIASDPDNVEALWRASRMLSNLAGRSSDKHLKLQKAEEANRLALRAVKADKNSKEARLSYIIALGLLSEAAPNPAEKLRNAKVIYAQVIQVLNLDSLYAPAYYVLGKWHLELARLSWAEKLACNILFGGIPKGVSMEKSIKYFERAIELQPDYILFHYGRASALYHAGMYSKAISALEHAIRLKSVEPDDKIRKRKCQVLLHESKLQSARINLSGCPKESFGEPAFRQTGLSKPVFLD